ncbi:ABC transporter ATP-binding protein [Rhodobacteraceae bacterium W635]|uniref:ABC transporter ATP-binding protein n=1 Tax=Nioella halotolerans TaxID=2303578 RepID=UPI000E3EB525|nr:ABC transporter ATP-binding protein [Rhodobacteraceae bacterium W635]
MLTARNITRRFGQTEVLHDITLDIPDGTFTSLLGPSGCGKSTFLRILAGLDMPSSGRVLMDGRDVSDLRPAERNVAMVFQAYALYPHLTVAENIALPLAMREMSAWQRVPLVSRILPATRETRRSHHDRVAAIAEMLGIGDLLDRKPAALSGGQQQRVAVGRALVRDPSVFLLDEPLSNLDAALRVQMRAELAALHARTGTSFVHVTHDQTEAMSMSDRVAVMLAGRIAQLDTPRALYARPATRDVAAFIGTHSINLVDLPVESGGLGGAFAEFRPKGAEMPSRVTLGLRPEHLTPDPAGAIEGRLDQVEYLGGEALLHLRLPDGTALRSLAPGEVELPPPGESLRLTVASAHIHIFDSETGARCAATLEQVAA